ncbi:ester cyclase [Maribacter sp. MMG018]|uniref:ester cyclase n=1 Tax=Maribacter sp. MMG018 TaxID=2822688 RepID=UPI001B3975F2|nr:ester cyclase [Maribacter sp. MMG018]MBQ4914760.1 ester cyclase [Maribacter sp. MMG018]
MKHCKLIAVVWMLCMACGNKNSHKNNDPSPTPKPNISVLKQNTKKYLSAWSEYDTLLQQSVTIQKFVRNVNGENISYDQHELFKSMYFWHRAMPDILVVDKEITIVENRTYVNWECHGTNTGMLGDTPPTGKVGQTKGVSILTFDDAGKIVHEVTYFDMLNFMEDLGYSLSIPVMK